MSEAIPARDSIQHARSISRGCPECGGEGITSRYFTVRHNDRDLPGPWACICHRCAAGRWMASYYRANPPAGNTLYDLELRPDLQPEELKLPPEIRSSGDEEDAKYVDLFKRRAWAELEPASKRTPGRKLFGDLPPKQLEEITGLPVTTTARPTRQPEPEPELAELPF